MLGNAANDLCMKLHGPEVYHGSEALKERLSGDGRISSARESFVFVVSSMLLHFSKGFLGSDPKRSCRGAAPLLREMDERMHILI